MQPSRPYPSDLSDTRWELIRPTLEAWRQARNGIRKPIHDLRTLMNAILYVDRAGIPWRYLPHDFPPHQSVYGYFARWEADGIFDQLTGLLRNKVRQDEGRTIEPSACLIDSQSIKTSATRPPDQPRHRPGQENHRTQAAHRHRHPRPPAGRHHHRRQRPRLRSRHPAPGQSRRTPPDRHQSLGRQRLQDQSHRTRRPPRHRPRDRPTRPHHPRLPRPVPPLGR